MTTGSTGVPLPTASPTKTSALILASPSVPACSWQVPAGTAPWDPQADACDRLLQFPIVELLFCLTKGTSFHLFLICFKPLNSNAIHRCESSLPSPLLISVLISLRGLSVLRTQITHEFNGPRGRKGRRCKRGGKKSFSSRPLSE